jgi:cytochrome c oxidase subunit 2
VSSRPTRRRRLALLVTAVAITATACAHNAPQDTLKPAGPEARYIDNLFFPVFWIAVVVFCLVAGLVLYASWRFRARGEDDRPRQIHGSTKLEITWTIIPALLLIGVGAASVIGIFHLARVPKGTPITVQAASATSGTMTGDVLHVDVIAHRWWFEFDYPGMGTGLDHITKKHDALVTAGEIHIPAGKDVYLSITSDEPAGSRENAKVQGGGVIHNFWLPKLGGKIYAIPGRVSHVIINAYSPGIYSGQCTEFCGISHANMRMRAVAQSATDFAAWVVNQQQPAAALTPDAQFGSPDAYAGYQLFNGLGNCSGCHTVSGTTAQGVVGPNLTHLQARGVFAGAIFALNDANLRLWLRNPQAAKPGANMVIPKLTEDQITSLIAYLDTLK